MCLGIFALLLTLPVLHFFLSSGSIESGHLLVLLIVLALAFGVLIVGLYRPFYLQDFLPNLEAVINGYHENQQRVVIAGQQEIITRQDHELRLLKQLMAVQAKQYFIILENCRQEANYRTILGRLGLWLVILACLYYGYKWAIHYNDNQKEVKLWQESTSHVHRAW